MKIRYNETAQKFFYVSNLSEWDFSCSREYNHCWLRTTGPLSEEEKGQLDAFRRIISRHGYGEDEGSAGDKYLGSCFYDFPEDGIWQCASAILNKREYGKLNRVFDVFDEKFSKIWAKDKKRLLAMADALEARFSLEKKEGRALNGFEKLFSRIPNDFSICLLAAPEQSRFMGGGANTGPGNITLELRSPKDSEDGFYVALHELAHLVMQREKRIDYGCYEKERRERLRKLPVFEERDFDDGYEFESALEECILLTLVPDGILNKNIKDKWKGGKIGDQSDLEHYLVHKIKTFADYYLSEGLKVDQKYADKVMEILEEAA